MRGFPFFVLVLSLAFGGCATVPPVVQNPSATVPSSPGVFHTVERGQTLWRIARIYGADLNSVMAANGISDPSRVEAGRRLFIPSAGPLPGTAASGGESAAIARQIGFPHGNVTWHTITVHHSATRYGNGKVFDRYHRRRGMQGLFYHFLIGNGNGLGDGEIEVGWRWRQQFEVNRPQDIQICLVGNFMRHDVSERQYQTLKGLITVLRTHYGITLGGIRRHCDVAAKATCCPGTEFPYERLMRDLRSGE